MHNGEITHNPHRVIESVTYYFLEKQRTPEQCTNEQGEIMPLPSRMLELLKPQQPLNTDEPHDRVDIVEIRKLLRGIKKTSAPGMDGLTISMINNLSDYALKRFGEAINDVLNGRHTIGYLIENSLMQKQWRYHKQSGTTANM